MPNERLDEALRWAAETLEGYKELGPILGPSDEAAQEYLTGWAEAVSILADIADDPRDGFAKLDSYQRRKLGDTQRAFITAMLGGDHD